MSERERFPFLPDREVIDAWLSGAMARENQEAWITLMGGTLTINQGPGFAWFDTAGALVFALPGGPALDQARLVLAYIVKQLGMPEATITREVRDEADPDGRLQRQLLYFIDGMPVRPGAPTVLCGPMTIQAYRASRRE